jgi:ADP-ribose pyrophosphatase YjhB (NUDIX family)
MEHTRNSSRMEITSTEIHERIRKCEPYEQKASEEQVSLELKTNIDIVESFVQNPSKGLPEKVFLFVTRMTAMINVDLLIKNENNQTLLTWRDDGYYLPGWHVPGGIMRYKEKIFDRVLAVGKNELGAEVKFDPVPIAINEVIHETRKNRGHFISLLYRCSLVEQPDERLRCKSALPNKNEWLWHDACPDNIISVHEMYRKLI